MNLLTALNGSKNKTWLKNRIANGTILVEEKDEKRINGSHEYYPITKENALRLLSSMYVWQSTNNEIIGAYGTSYYFRFILAN